MICPDQTGTVVTMLIDMELMRRAVLMQGSCIKLRMLYRHQFILGCMP